jgi:polyferredoxin
MTFKELKAKRKRLQSYTWYGLPLVAVLGWVYPLLGYLLLGCMAGAVGIAAFRGRAWCDWMCPRGAFFDLFVARVSRDARIPGWIRSPWTRAFMAALLMGVLGTQIVVFWGDWERVGLAFVILLTVTTLVGIGLGLAYSARAWCLICPMGTFGALLSTGKKPLSIDAAACNACGACAKVCPMQLDPAAHAGKGVVAENDCIKCSSCTAVCPRKALSFAPSCAVRKAA